MPATTPITTAPDARRKSAPRARRRSAPPPLRGGAWRGWALAFPALAATTLVFGASMVLMLLYSFRSFESGTIDDALTTGTWTSVLGDGFYWGIVWRTFRLGLITVAVCLAIGYPTAYALARLRHPRLRILALFVIFSPLLTSVVVRTYGWSLVLGDSGFINSTLDSIGLVDRPLALLYQFPGVVISLVHILLPFMVLPIYSVLGQVDSSLREAAVDLGATPLRAFVKVTLPLTLQGVVAGCQLVFALSVSAFATPALLGGGRVQVLATRIYQDVGEVDWPGASVLSWLLLAMALVALALLGVTLRGGRRTGGVG
jgi:ABC-type spermidine/putrescine transport system permease subunit I